MAELIILGASNAIPTRESENTHFAVLCGARTVLVDCATNPLLSLERAGVAFNAITDIVLTHFHPDHVSGLPLFLMDMWLLGRMAPLHIHGLDYTLDRAEKMMGLYGWEDWPNLFPVKFHHLPEVEMATVLDAPELRITAALVRHILPNIGLRFDFKVEKSSLAYSSDTEPCPAVIKLARGADVLLHEASGPFNGHTSAAQAGEMAARAGVGTLYLVHYPTGRFSTGDLAAEARQYFSGTVTLAHDLMRILL